MRANEFIKEDHGPTLAGEWWEIIKDKLGIGDSNNHQKYLDNFKKQPHKIPPPKRKFLRGRAALRGRGERKGRLGNNRKEGSRFYDDGSRRTSNETI